MLSLTWAMSVFGLRQMGSFLSPQMAQQNTTAFDRVTRCTEEQLGSLTRSTFRAGDNLQRGMVDAMFSTLSPDILDPNRVLGLSIDLLQRGVNAVYELTSAASRPVQGQSGWGPMPPPPRG